MDEAARLVAALAVPEGRYEAAQVLARHVSATTLLAFIEDPSVEAWLPAPGFPQTLPQGPAWRAFLAGLGTPDVSCGDLTYPVDQRTSALACTEHGLTLLFLAPAEAPVRPEAIEPIRVLLPLVAGLLRAEHAAHVAQGELEAALSHARQVETLARALDAARAEVERTVHQLEGQTRAAGEARARAEEATQAKDEFLAMLGHELRNPLSPILTAIQLLRLKGQASRELEVIDRQIGGLIRLVDDLLDVSRFTRGKIELRTEPVDVADVAAQAIEMASPLIEQKRQRLTLDVPRGLIVNADAARLAQVLSNLLTNAAKYSNPGTSIHLAASREPDAVRIRVRDEGIGIAPEMLPRIFDLFVQHSQSIARSQGGLGLGLAIVRSLVAMHGGSVAACSDGEGTGSEFTVTLPAAGAIPRSPAPERQPVRLRPTAAAVRVLVVDDNEDAATLMAGALELAGYDVRVAHDGPGALTIAATFAPQLALLDIGLPVMDGYELARQLRAQAGDALLRLVAVTGYGREGDRRRSAEAGFDAHLVKPIHIEDLQAVIDALTD